MKNKLKAAIYGLAVADAIGVPVEFKARGSYHVDTMIGYGTHHQPAGTWSDDTSMTIATCDSIRECGKVDTSDIFKKFEDWYFRSRYTVDGLFDIGGTTALAIRRCKPLDDEFSNGNGSLMRILPLAFTDASEQEVEDVSALTHAHKTSRMTCVHYVTIARRIAAGEELKGIIRSMNFESPFHRIHSIYSLTEDEIKSTGYVVDTFEAAVWAVATTDNYRDAVLKAVNLGDDTDTVAAVAGGLAGILYGMEGIPAEWIDQLRGKEVIDKCLF